MYAAPQEQFLFIVEACSGYRTAMNNNRNENLISLTCRSMEFQRFVPWHPKLLGCVARRRLDMIHLEEMQLNPNQRFRVLRVQRNDRLGKATDCTVIAVKATIRNHGVYLSQLQQFECTAVELSAVYSWLLHPSLPTCLETVFRGNRSM